MYRNRKRMWFSLLALVIICGLLFGGLAIINLFVVPEIRFNTFGGSEVETIVKKTGETVEAPQDPSKEGNIFKGWFTDKACTRLYTFSTMPDKSIMLYAKWDPIKLNITFEYNATGTPQSATKQVNWGTTLSYDDLVNLFAVPTKEGYTGKWVVDSNSLVNIKSNFSVSAEYSINKYTVTFVNYDDSIVKTESVDYLSGAIAPESNPTKVGYDFDGWDTDFSSITKDLIVHANYKIKHFTVIFVDADGNQLSSQDVTYLSPATAPATNPEKNGFIFSGWDSDYSQIKDNITIKPVFDKDSYIVTFVDYNGNVLSTQSIKFEESASAPVSPTRENYKFKSWDIDFSKVTSNLTVKAIYDRVKYVLTLDTNGGNGNLQPITINVGDALNDNLPQTLTITKTNYAFGGWNSKNDGSGSTISKDYVLTDDSTIYIDWYECIESNWSCSGTTEKTILGYTGSNKNKIAIPSSINDVTTTTIGNGTSALFGLSDVKHLLVPNSVKTISSKSFNNVYGVENLEFAYNSTLQTIGSYAFSFDEAITVPMYSYTSLKHITIPKSVVSIEDYAFKNAISLIDINVEDDNMYFASENGILFNKSKTTLISVPSKTANVDVTLPSTLTKIASYASYNYCRKRYGLWGQYIRDLNNTIKSLKVPNTLTDIGDYAFYKCFNLTSLTSIDDKDVNFNNIGNYAFSECNLLATFKINSIKTLGTYAFNGTIISSINLTGLSIISDYAFNNCTALKNVVLDNTLTTIGNYAFSSDSLLSSITLGDNATTIGNFAFSGCYNMTSFTIPDTSKLQSFGSSAFYGCSKIQSIFIPNNVTSLSSSLFYNCSALSSLTFGSNENLKTINSNALYGTSALTTIELPDSVSTIEDGAFISSGISIFRMPQSLTTLRSTTFKDCKITEFTVSSTNTTYSAVNGVLYSYDQTKLLFYPIYNTRTSFAILSTIKIIGDYAFYNSQYLTSIDFTSSTLLESIGNFSFFGCKFSSLTLNSGVKSIGQNGFASCSSLTSFNLPTSVNSIGDYCFKDCANLASFVIPDNSLLVNISNGCFANCMKLSSITFGTNVALTTISTYAFEYCSFNSITLPSTITTIQNYAFESVSNLETLTIPVSCINIATRIISNSSIKYVIIPETCAIVKLSGDNFSNDKNLISISILSNSLKTIGSDLLEFDTNLETINLPTNGVLETINSYAFENLPKINNIVIPSSVKTIDYRAFENCSSLSTITFNSGLQTIESEAFINDILLNNVSIPDSVTKIGDHAFSGCTSLANITLSNNLTTLSNYILNGTIIETLIIPKNLTTVSLDAFIGMSKLKTFTLDEFDTQHFIDTSGVLYNKDKTSLLKVPNIMSIDTYSIIDTVSSIESGALTNVSGIKTLNLPTKITEIKSYFIKNSSFETINLGYGSYVQAIRSSAFDGNTSIKSVNIAQNQYLQTIEEYAFRNCSNLSSFTFDVTDQNNVLSKIGVYAFYNCSSLTSFVIPYNVTSIGNYAFNWCSKLSQVTVNPRTPPVLTSSSTVFANNATGRKFIVGTRKLIYVNDATNGWSYYSGDIVDKL
jgi:uncharacterized repeat protein (TIGR02543 family)